MKNLIFALICVGTSFVLKAQNNDLTGTWKDDNGAIYFIHQIDHDIYWSMENLPKVRNVFVGIQSGVYFTGKWIDLPGGNIVGSGTMTLQVTSSDRFIKIDQTRGPYGGNVWTRTTNIEIIRVVPPIQGAAWGSGGKNTKKVGLRFGNGGETATCLMSPARNPELHL
jgi:hypothetical protein